MSKKASTSRHLYKSLPKFWRGLARQVLFPRVKTDDNDAVLQDLHDKLPIPVIWLLGKTQAGKTSIIRELTGCEDAEIGQGFKACTRTARLYEFPSEDECLLKFLDTRGLGEVSYDPSEDLAAFQAQAHILLLVLRAMDQNQTEVLAAFQQIRAQHPELPVLVVQTALHEGYPDAAFEHIQPYPFDADLQHTDIPDDLRRALQHQRQWFADVPDVRFVAVDFTQAEEGYDPANYGAEALWTALLDDTMPQSMRSIFQMMRASSKARYTAAAHPHIISYSLMAALAEAVPIPMVSVPVVLSIQAKMFQSIASIYGQTLSYERFAEIAGLLGSGYLLGIGGRQLLKFIPVYGEAVTAVYSGATTYALGHLLCMYFDYQRRGETMDQATFEAAFSENVEQAKGFIAEMLKNRKPKNDGQD